MLVCAVLLVFGVVGVQHSDAAQCDPFVVAKINEIWRVSGYPANLFQLHTKTWTLYKTTRSPNYNGVKCLSFERVGDNQFTFDRDGSNGIINVTQVDGRIYIEGDDTNYYMVFANDDVTANYACSETNAAEFCDGIPDARISISPTASKESIDMAERVQASLGFKLDKTFSC